MSLDPLLEICISSARDQSMAALPQILLPVVRERGSLCQDDLLEQVVNACAGLALGN